MKAASFAFLAGAAAQHPSFEEWAARYGINGASDSMRANYAESLAQVLALEAEEGQMASFEVNQFSGMSWAEFSSSMLTFHNNPLVQSDMPIFSSEVFDGEQVGDIDWDVTPVKDQGSCGSCWAFGTIGGIEAKHKQATGETVQLSEQQLVDCDKSCDGSGSTTCDSHCNCGCDGGQADWAYAGYLTDQATYTMESYPYKGRASVEGCQTGVDSGIRLSGFVATDPMTDSSLQASLNDGVVVVAVAANFQFQLYSGGILTNPPTNCLLNHQVMATGYGENYWKIKNSWGASWGEAGFIRFEQAEGNCGPFGLFAYKGVVPSLTASAIAV